MSRRESRVSMNVRQNDPLVEFEAFKKKFLLANKHITKLNSTLSVRIEELNAQISTLYVENLRLRASEIALAAQLKREREKSKKIMADTEAATANLSKHLTFLRHSFNIDHPSPPPSSPPRRARRPLINPMSPPFPKLSRPPDVPGIFEDDEECSDNELKNTVPCPPEPPSPPRRKTKPKARLSASRLPLPSRGSSPPLPVTVMPSPRPGPLLEMEVPRSPGNRKPSRRQSGLVNMNATRGSVDPDRNEMTEMLVPPRVPSPAFGSPIRKEVPLDDDDDEINLLDSDGEFNVDVPALVEDEERQMAAKREKKKGKSKDSDRERYSAIESSRPRERERKRTREDDDGGTSEGIKSKLKDVTNSPRSRQALPPSDVSTTDRDRRQPSDSDTTNLAASSTTRTFLSTPPSTSEPTSQLPTPRPSSSPDPLPAVSDAEAALLNGRERRAKKSVNYTEPKLNTKMRKPDPPPGTTTISRKRPSVSTSTCRMSVSAPQSEGDVDDPAPRSSIERESIPQVINHRSFSPPPPPASSLPSVYVTSRPSSSSSSRSSAATSIKRKKSRSYSTAEGDDAEESDGAQADVDLDYAGTRVVGWVNIGERRRSHVHKKTASDGSDSNGMVRRRVDDEDMTRRHSMAV